MKVVLDHIEAEAPSILTFYFRPERALPFVAGQFVELSLKHRDADTRGDKRLFTLSSSPTDDLLSITYKFATQDGSSFKTALTSLKPGDSLTMSQPRGSFVLPKHAKTPLVFVAGGIGIAPFRSMVAWLAKMGEERSIKLFYGVSNEEEIIFQSTFKKLRQDVSIVISNPSPGWSGERGYLNAKLILGLKKLSEDALIYISGPEGMVKSLRKDFYAAGVSESQLVLDRFTGYRA